MISDELRAAAADRFNVYLGSELLAADIWSIFNDERGFGVIFNTAIPEPSTYATIFAVLALVFAACRKRKQFGANRR